MTPRSLLAPGRLAGATLLGAQSDERLVDLTRAGSHRAFEAIVERYRRPLLRYVRRLVPAWRAEDVLQESLAAAHRALCTDERPLDLRPWLYRIVHNRCVSVLREVAPAQVELPATLATPDALHGEVERRDTLRRLLAAIEELPESQRSAILLRELEDRSHEEIGAALGVSGGAARQLLHRARTNLRAGMTAFTPPLLLPRLLGDGAPAVAGLGAAGQAAGAGVAGVAVKAAATVSVVAGLAVGAGVPGGERADETHPGRAPVAGHVRAEAGPGGPAVRAVTSDVTARSRRARSERARRGDRGRPAYEDDARAPASVGAPLRLESERADDDDPERAYDDETERDELADEDERPESGDSDGEPSQPDPEQESGGEAEPEPAEQQPEASAGDASGDEPEDGGDASP